MERLISKFLANPCYLTNGSGSLSRKWNCTREEIIEARAEAKKRLKKDNKTETANYISALEEEIFKITEQQTDHKTGNQTITIQSSKPLSPKEIDSLAQVDNITSFVDRTWLKSHKNNTWTYSINTIRKIKDFYSADELTIKLKDIFKEESQYIPKQPISTPQKALMVYIGDDHCGLVLKDSLYNKEYSGTTYAQRLLQIVEEIQSLPYTFEEIIVIRMGDELDGYNAKTTRYDHTLDSLSNKEQFDIYTIANKVFYDALFQSGKAVNYGIINLNNSNHSGLGFSYITNKALEFWIEAKYINVYVKQQTKFIDVIKYGNHIIGLTHGKDEKYMKSPMPLNLDYKTDLWLMEYYNQYIQEGAFISTIKADIHKYNVNQGKSGRYVNVPSISSGSTWIEHNFGDSQPGVLMEIYTADNKNIQSIPIWF